MERARRSPVGSVSISSAFRRHIPRPEPESRSLKNAKGDLALRRSVVRRVLAFTLIVAGVSILLSGVESAFFR
jgi:hypothetical protein